jgi:hypothetical protein
MKESLAVELLRSLNRDELKELGDLVRSPYFNKSNVVIKLYSLLIKHSPGYTSRALERERIFKKLYPGKDYNEGTLKTRMAELTALIKEFILQSGLKNKHLERKIWLGTEYYKRKLFTLSEKKLNEAAACIEKDNITDTSYFRNKLLVLSEMNTLNLSRDMKHENYTISLERGEYLVNYSLNFMMQIMNDIEVSGMEAKVKPEFSAVNEFLKSFNIKEYLTKLEENNYKYYPALAIAYYGYASFLEPENEEYFFILKELVFTHYDKISASELYNFWSLLSNSAFLHYLKKGLAYAEQSHEINKFFIEKNILPASSHFPPLLYQNAVLNAIIVKDIEWAESFAVNYKERVIHETRENRFNYVMALIEFEKKNYERSLQYSSSLIFNDIFDKINARMVILKNYYELGHWEQVLSMLDSLKHFITENKELPEYTVTRLRKMIKHMGRAAGAKFSMKKLDYADYKEAENDKPFQISEWILIKMKELL